MGTTYNPFSMSHWNPQTVRFRMTEDSGDPMLWKGSNWWGGMYGPNGRGKSTWLAEMGRYLSQVEHREVLWYKASESLGGWFGVFVAIRKLSRRGTLLLDSAECLPLFLLWLLVLQADCRGQSILMTVHDRPKPWLADRGRWREAICDPETLYRVIVEETAGWGAIDWLTRDLVEQLLIRHSGHGREVLYDLYCLWESHQNLED